jgi:hypothetical protein
MDKKLKLLQEKINNAVGIAALSCPYGVSVDFWDKAMSDLFEANNLINEIVAKLKLTK